jgi:hypothetical protein
MTGPHNAVHHLSASAQPSPAKSRAVPFPDYTWSLLSTPYLGTGFHFCKSRLSSSCRQAQAIASDREASRSLL